QDAVEAADEVVAGPDLEAVGDAGPVEGAVGGLHLAGDPGRVPVGAAGDDGVEGVVHGRLPAGAAQALAEGAGHRDSIREQDGAGTACCAKRPAARAAAASSTAGHSGTVRVESELWRWP